MSMDQFDATVTPIPRDRFGRPLVTPPDGGKPVGYTRCTTFVDCLDDKYNLQKWQQRMVATGLSARPDLLLAVAAHRDDKAEMDRLCQQALDAAQASAAATTGTALHALTERIDRGQPLGVIPEAYLADLEAYQAATVELEPVEIEAFSVLDEYRIGGTPDRVYRFRGEYFIGDVKTGSIDFGALKIAMQLAVYSRSTPYDHRTKVRTPRPFILDTTRAIVVHLPAGTGTCELRWVDVAAGWDAVACASRVRQWRAHKGWYSPFTSSRSSTGTTFDPAADRVGSARAAIAAAADLDTLRALYERAVASGVDGAQILPDCLARKAELEVAA